MRNFLVFSFVSLFCFAGWVFYVRPTDSLRQKISNQQSDSPILLLENFVVFRHERGAHLISRISGDRGEFYSSNRVEVHGHLHAWRVKNGREESLHAQEGRAWISQRAGGGRPFAGEAKLDRAEVEKDVVVARDDYTLTTEQAEYQAKSQSIMGHLPVKLRGRGHWILGQEGFTVGLEKEEVHLLGRVQGAAQLEEAPHSP